MTYDAQDGYVLFFGGSNGRNDTWSFSANTWTEISPSSGPSPRNHMGMADDAADSVVVLFGGAEGNQTYNDTWEYRAGTWTKVATSVAPSPRWGVGMAYDVADGYILLFGGLDNHTTYSDTWTFRAGVWTNISAAINSTPTSRYGPGMVYDSADGYVVMYGGWSSTQPKSSPVLSDTWEFVGGQWKQLRPATNPGPLWFLGMSYDTADQKVVLFGGINRPGKTPTNTFPLTWTFVHGEWTNVTGGPAPSARFSETIGDDVPGNNVVMFGGLNSTIVNGHSLGDTWTFSGDTWINLSGKPPVLFSGTFVETGLGSGISWTVTLAGVQTTSSKSSISFSEPTGTYLFRVGSVPGCSAYPASGNYTVQHQAWSVTIQFNQTSACAGGLLGLSPPWDYVLIGGIAFAALMVIVVLVVRYRRRRPRLPTPSKASPTLVNQNSPEQSPGTTNSEPRTDGPSS